MENNDTETNLTEAPGSSENPPTTVQTRRFSVKQAGILALVFVLLTVLALLYIYYIAPKRALGAYVAKLERTETASFVLDVFFEGAFDRESNVRTKAELTANGSFDSSDQANQKVRADIAGSVDFGGSSFKLSNAQIVMSAKVLYFKLGELGLSGAFGELQNQWYKLDLSNSETESCTPEDYQKIRQYTVEQSRQLSLRGTRRVGLLPEKVDGHRAARYAGEIDANSLKDQLLGVRSAVSESCRETLADESSLAELASYTITYDVWNSRSFNKLKIVFRKPDGNVLELTVATRDYGRAAAITVPADARDIGSELFDTFTPPEAEDSSSPPNFESNPAVPPEGFFYNPEVQTEVELR